MSSFLGYLEKQKGITIGEKVIKYARGCLIYAESAIPCTAQHWTTPTILHCCALSFCDY